MFVGLKLATCTQGESYFRLRQKDNGRASGIVRGTDDASMTIASWGDKSAVKKHQDDRLVALPYDANKNKFSTMFVPEY